MTFVQDKASMRTAAQYSGRSVRKRIGETGKLNSYQTGRWAHSSNGLDNWQAINALFNMPAEDILHEPTPHIIILTDYPEAGLTNSQHMCCNQDRQLLCGRGAPGGQYRGRH